MSTEVSGLTDEELSGRVAICPVHGGAWSYKCSACIEVHQEVCARNVVFDGSVNEQPQTHWQRPAAIGT